MENPVDPDDFSLVAVSGSDGPSIAVVRQVSSDQTFYLRKGDAIAGLEVQSVEARSNQVGKGDETFIIAMFKPESVQDSSTPDAERLKSRKKSTRA